MNKYLIIVLILASAGSFLIGFRFAQNSNSGQEEGLLSAFIAQHNPEPRPLLQYTPEVLAQREYQPSAITILEETERAEDFARYTFSYQTLGQTMTGQLTLPIDLDPEAEPKVIVLLRGYIPAETYQTGDGTRNAAGAFAKAGYVAIAPDFFSHGGSDPEPDDAWEARLEKPISVIELIETIKQDGIPVAIDTTPGGSTRQQQAAAQENDDDSLPISSKQTTNIIGLWGHSNGGQIALSTLQVLSEPIPTTLWAPVTAPFPYSVLFFSDTHDDEGKGMRLWVAQLEEQYDVSEFSLTRHLNRLAGPLLLHHGLLDEAAPYWWSDRFEDLVAAENERRRAARSQQAAAARNATDTATDGAEGALEDDPDGAANTTLPTQTIDLQYYRYTNTDHNMRPNWNTVVGRDLDFFRKQLR